MTATTRCGAVPHLDVDPFALEFFADPFPTHERLREAGPVVYLDKWNVYGVARYAEVHAVLNDPATFCSSRGVGLERLLQGEAVAAAEPDPGGRSAGPYPHPHGAEHGAVGDRDEAASRAICRRRGGSCRRAAGEAQVRRDHRPCGSLSAVDLPRCARPEAGGPRASAALCEPGVQRLRTAQPAPPGRDRALGAASSLCRRAVPARQPHPGGIGACIHAHVDSGAITATEAPLLVRSLLSAGLGYHRSTASVPRVYCLARFPDQFERLRGDPTLARNAFEEAVRFESPVQTFFRTTTRDDRDSAASPSRKARRC